MTEATSFAIAAASHSEPMLAANLRLSPMIAEGNVPLHVEWNAPSAAIAYNRALDATDAPYLILAHHDVFLPKGWDRLLAARIAELDAMDPDWALLGAFGVAPDAAHIGPVWSSSLGMIVGRVPIAPVQVQSFDEMLMVVKRGANLRFDESLPGWHMYGTDIVQIAGAQGKTAYAGALPCIHNDRYHDALGADFTECYRFMQKKWAARLPLRTPITKISRHGLHLLRDNWHNRRSGGIREAMSVGTDTDPRDYARRCGWSDLTASA